jgi:ketosteroid isomerase-like protein
VEPIEVVSEYARRFNSGDVDGSVELYAEDARMVSSPEWPEQFALDDREAIRAYTHEWTATWASSEMSVRSIETHGDKVLVFGEWTTRGRSSGVEGTMPVAMVFTVRDGRIAILEWFNDHDAAARAARGT